MVIRRGTFVIVFSTALVALCTSGCRSAYHYSEPTYSQRMVKGAVLADFEIDRSLEDEILALDPDNVTEAQVREILYRAPAPRIVNINGGIYPVYRAMVSFSEFLMGMGYPEGRIRNPRDGTYSFSCYDSSEKIAGAIAWYYEHEGMRPIIVGHSQGGMQAVKVLHQLNGEYDDSLRVYNPLVGRFESRTSIMDPVAGEKRPVVGTMVSYASAVGAGGITRFMPNQWSLGDKLRRIPDTVVEFTGFYKHGDLLGGDLFGFSAENKYYANGKANVRSVLLPFNHNHYFVPYTDHLVGSREVRDWINHYEQTEEPTFESDLDGPTTNIVWAADVWTSIKRHWVLELKRLIIAKREYANAD